MDNRQVWLIVGATILALALVGGLMMAGGADEAGAVFMAPAGLTIFNPIFWIILLIVVAARRNKQQQQQQVVVVNGPPPEGGPKVRCTQCQGLSRGDAAFCGHCGLRFA